MPLVLVSQSPRRRELLAAAGIVFEVRQASVEEIRREGEAPEAYVLRLAGEKARAGQRGAGEVLLGADTVVVLGQQILEKPADVEEAKEMLRALSGKTHVVITGVCLRQGVREVSAAERTEVEFLPLSEEEIAEYVATGEPFDKAGGYGIQGFASRFAARINGCYFNVVGLPVARLCRLYRELTGEPV